MPPINRIVPRKSRGSSPKRVPLEKELSVKRFNKKNKGYVLNENRKRILSEFVSRASDKRLASIVEAYRSAPSKLPGEKGFSQRKEDLVQYVGMEISKRKSARKWSLG